MTEHIIHHSYPESSTDNSMTGLLIAIILFGLILFLGIFYFVRAPAPASTIETPNVTTPLVPTLTPTPTPSPAPAY